MAKELEFIDLSVSSGQKLLLSKARGALRSGELVAVVGRSGSGKTLLTKAIMGLLPEQLQAEGQVLLDGQRLDQLGDKAMDQVRGRRISMLFQQPKRVMNPRMTIRAHLLEAMGSHGWGKARQHEHQVLALLEEVGLFPAAQIAGKRPDQLSGGMAQRAMLAIALAADPEFILADEPTSSLDSILKAEVLQLLRRKQQERGVGVLFITHDIASIQHIADRVVVVSDGQIVDQCPTAQIFSKDRHAKTRELVDAALPALREPRTRSSGCLLESVEASKNYTRRAKGQAALKPTSLRLHGGQVLGVVGRSGSGKSTFARLLAGLEQPTTGHIITKHKDEVDTRVQVIAQEPYSSFDPRLAIRTSMSAAVHRLPVEQARERMAQAMIQVGLPEELLERRPGQCSGGQLQRLAIARALLTNPQVLICDESTSALDSVAQRHILDLLLELRDKMGLSLVVISHDMDVIRYASDDVAVFYEGELVEHRPLNDFLANAEHQHSKDLVAALDITAAATAAS
ncbi:ABC transporter ATP-binding protein [Glutamicibacter halophytocola]|uniref:ABC transporter ATP-binding protein n=1 Tax=Glutamicibacter halophytocola TaxID=1933880 RepID=A0AA94XQS4_9MICC|nr:ABC transporter ATP-binding protein [Glutamicibacter halophytocola]UUX58701.1 ABC transporter ATP-binding protein [Glutamicibacter halophytocola]